MKKKRHKFNHVHDIMSSTGSGEMCGVYSTCARVKYRYVVRIHRKNVTGLYAPCGLFTGPARYVIVFAVRLDDFRRCARDRRRAVRQPSSPPPVYGPTRVENSLLPRDTCRIRRSRRTTRCVRDTRSTASGPRSDRIRVDFTRTRGVHHLHVVDKAVMISVSRAPRAYRRTVS